MKRIFRIFHKKKDTIRCTCSLKSKEHFSKRKAKEDIVSCSCSRKKDVRSKSSGRERYQGYQPHKLRNEISESTLTDQRCKKHPSRKSSENEIREHKKNCALYQIGEITTAESSESCTSPRKQPCPQHSKYSKVTYKNKRKYPVVTASEASTDWLSSKGTYLNDSGKTESSSSVPNINKNNKIVNTTQCHCVYQAAKIPRPKNIVSHRKTRSSHVLPCVHQNSRHAVWCSQRKRDMKICNATPIVNNTTESNKPRAGILKNKIVAEGSKSAEGHNKDVIISRRSRGTSPVSRVNKLSKGCRSRVTHAVKKQGSDTYQVYQAQVYGSSSNSSQKLLDIKNCRQSKQKSRNCVGQSEAFQLCNRARQSNYDFERDTSAADFRDISKVKILKRTVNYPQSSGNETPRGFLRLPRDPKIKVEILQSLKAAGIQYRIPNNR